MMQRPFNITSLFFDRAQEAPGRIAIIDGQRQVTFGQLADLVDRTAQYFLSKGIRKGDNVLVFIPMSVDLYRIVLALFRIGAVAVFVDEWVSLKRLELCCDIAQCRAVIGGWKVRLLSLVSATIRRIPVHLGKGYRKHISGWARQETGTADTALITFTTGSTGTPKAAKRTHGFLRHQFDALEAELGIAAGETGIIALPIVLFLSLGLGCTAVIATFNPKKKRKMDTARIVSQLGQYKADMLIGSPFFIQQLAAYVSARNMEMPYPGKVVTGGAPVFPREARQYIKAFPQARIKIVYGSTEAEPISSIEASGLFRFEAASFTEGLNVGRPAPVAEVLIIPYKDEPLEAAADDVLYGWSLPSGTIGEIIVAGPHVLDAYYNNPDALLRNKIFTREQCWHRTGDSGFMKDGHLYLTGRCSTLIPYGDTIIAPFLIENLLQSAAGVAAGTVLQGASGPVIVAEVVRGADPVRAVQNIHSLNIGIPDVRLLPHLPRDPRHYSKIDYEACKLLLQ